MAKKQLKKLSRRKPSVAKQQPGLLEDESLKQLLNLRDEFVVQITAAIEKAVQNRLEIDRGPWRRPQFTKPIGFTPLGSQYEQARYADAAIRDEELGASLTADVFDTKKVVKPSEELEEAKEEDLSPAVQAIKEEEINKLLTEVKADLDKVGVKLNGDEETLKDTLETALSGDKLEKALAAAEEPKPEPKKYILTEAELETLFTETQKNIEAKRAAEAAEAAPVLIVTESRWEKFLNWFRGA